MLPTLRMAVAAGGRVRRTRAPARSRCSTSGGDESTAPKWEAGRMPDEQFEWMKTLIAAPSPIGHEAAMTEGVLRPYFEDFMPKEWQFRTFTGNAGAVVDTDPHDTTGKLKVMICGHADKIRMQVRYINDDGKVYVDSDSFLPSTLIGNRVTCFSRPPGTKAFTTIPGTIEAGIKGKDLYLELGVHGKDGKKQVEDMGIRPGDCLIMDRPIQRCMGQDTFSGAYLDNGLGCFVAAQAAARLAASHDRASVTSGSIFDNVRGMFAFASHEEIGRFGSRILVSELKPDVLIAVDVNHDYKAAPMGKDERHTPLAMGEGFTVGNGNIASPRLNELIEEAALKRGLPMQRDMRGRDSGTDAMAGVLGNVDCAATSLGFPIRNMHTVSELGHTGDVLACVEAVCGVMEDMAHANITAAHFQATHPRLDLAEPRR